MEMFPICNVCRRPFTLRGSSPYLLPCLHDVCEKCVTISSGGMITCNTCKCDTNLSEVQLRKAAATESQILHLAIKERPEDLPCTHEDDGSQAVYWCQECQEMLCAFCQKMHQSFKAMANHDLRKLTDINEDILHKEKYCAVHRSYPLDTWDKTCRLMLCSRCIKMHHGDHELEDIGLAAMSRKQLLKSTGIEVRSALTAHIGRHSDMCSHKKLVIQETAVVKTKVMKTFSTLRASLDSKEKTLLRTLEKLTERMLKTISQDIKCSEAMQHKCKATEEYIEKCLKFGSEYDIVSIDDRTTAATVECKVSSPVDKLDLKVPVFNNDGLNHLIELINCFSGVSEEMISYSKQYARKGRAQSEASEEVVMENSERTELSRIKDENSSQAPKTTTEELKSKEAVQSREKKTPLLKVKNGQYQWSPLNPEGKMQYDRDFLLQLQFSKDSLKKPDTLPYFPEIIPDKPTTKPDSGMRSGGGNYRDLTDFSTGFLRPSRGMSEKGSQGGGGGSMSKRGSEQRNRGDVRVIKNVSIQLDVKLHQSENAWKRQAELYRKVRSILNMLTPQTFQTLIKQVQGLVIDTEARLKGVTDIIFEKAISEPAFSVAYANMCRYLLTLKVPSDTKPGENVNFRVILLTRCQREFEKDKDTQLDLDRRKKDTEKTTDQKKAAEMKEELDQAITNARRRSIGNIRFIGELFKLKMSTETIMHDCVFKLLRSRDEENLECLCQLLTTIGKELESDKAKPRMDQYFQQMKKIVSEKKVSSRCRYMLQDVIDLRNDSWRPENNRPDPQRYQ